MKNNTTKTCKHCQTEIPYKAKVCPQCRKKVKGGFGKWIVIAIALLLIISLFGGGGDNEDPVKVGTVGQTDSENTDKEPSAEETSAKETNTNTETEQEISTEEEVVSKNEYIVGDILQDGDMKIVFMSSGEYTEQNEFLQPAEGYKYIYLQFSFENTSSKNDASVSAFSFEGYADGYSVEMYYGGEEALSATLSAGRTTTGFIYFTVPVKAEKVEIEYTPNMFLNRKIKFVYEGTKDSGYKPVINNKPTEGAYHVGDVVESSKLKITYLSCKEYVSDNMFIQPKEGYRFVTCEFEFENLGKSDEFISSYDFDCYADGSSCTESSYIREDALSATISSGRKAKGTVTFEIPIGAEVIEVEYLSNYWTSNRVVFTVE